MCFKTKYGDHITEKTQVSGLKIIQSLIPGNKFLWKTQSRFFDGNWFEAEELLEMQEMVCVAKIQNSEKDHMTTSALSFLTGFNGVIKIGIRTGLSFPLTSEGIAIK